MHVCVTGSDIIEKKSLLILNHHHHTPIPNNSDTTTVHATVCLHLSTNDKTIHDGFIKSNLSELLQDQEKREREREREDE